MVTTVVGTNETVGQLFLTVHGRTETTHPTAITECAFFLLSFLFSYNFFILFNCLKFYRFKPVRFEETVRLLVFALKFAIEISCLVFLMMQKYLS